VKKGTWAEISLEKLGENVRNLRSVLNPGVIFMAVVKADGYGHGGVEIAQKALKNGAGYLGVARGFEAVKLREKGITAPVLVFGSVEESGLEDLLQHDLTHSVGSIRDARLLSKAAERSGRNVKIHIKTDTGMGRLGFVAGNGDACIDAISRVAEMPWLDCEGIYSHLASSDEPDTSFAKRQIAQFRKLIEDLSGINIRFRLHHIANSAALLELPESHMDMVRAGIAMYGLDPSSHVSSERIEKRNGFRLKPVMSLKTRIIHLKNVEKGFPVSYGSTFVTSEKTVIATVSAGYADGLNRLLSSTGWMRVRDKNVRIIGRVCMDLTMLDLGNHEAQVGDEVLIFGDAARHGVTAGEIARKIGTINYEVVCSVSSRVKRYYGETV
jgi:alanine racemase